MSLSKPVPQPAKKESFFSRTTNFWTKSRANKRALLLAGVFLIACGCLFTPQADNQPTNPSLSEADSLSTAVSLAQTSVAQTQIAVATATPSEPTNTPASTNTPAPSATNTPSPAPIVLTGSGDSIVDVAKGQDPAVIHAKYTSGGNFIVQNYDANNQQIDLLVNAIDTYEGTRPLDFLVGEHTARLEIKASGPWEIQILPLDQVRHVTIPGNAQGTGDDVFYVDGESADLVTANAPGESNFIVFAYSDSGIDLVFNEIGPYTGTALLDSSTFMISLQAEGAWSLDITTK